MKLAKSDLQNGLPRSAFVLPEWDESWNRPVVYLIWKRIVGKSDQLQLVALCSNQEIAKIRLSGLNNLAKGYDVPTRYSQERVPLDHLFASEELGMSSLEEETIKSMVSGITRAADYYEARIDHLRKAASEKIEFLEARIVELESQLSERSLNEFIFWNPRCDLDDWMDHISWILPYGG